MSNSPFAWKVSHFRTVISQATNQRCAESDAALPGLHKTDFVVAPAVPRSHLSHGQAQGRIADLCVWQGCPHGCKGTLPECYYLSAITSDICYQFREDLNDAFNNIYPVLTEFRK